LQAEGIITQNSQKINKCIGSIPARHSERLLCELLRGFSLRFTVDLTFEKEGKIFGTCDEKNRGIFVNLAVSAR